MKKTLLVLLSLTAAVGAYMLLTAVPSDGKFTVTFSSGPSVKTQEISPLPVFGTHKLSITEMSAAPETEWRRTLRMVDSTKGVTEFLPIGAFPFGIGLSADNVPQRAKLCGAVFRNGPYWEHVWFSPCGSVEMGHVYKVELTGDRKLGPMLFRLGYDKRVYLSSP